MAEQSVSTNQNIVDEKPKKFLSKVISFILKYFIIICKYIIKRVKVFLNFEEWKTVFIKFLQSIEMLWIVGIPILIVITPFITMIGTEIKPIKLYANEPKGTTSMMLFHSRINSLINGPFIPAIPIIRDVTDNKKNIQIGAIEIHRNYVHMLQYYLTRREGTGGDNTDIKNVRGPLFNDYAEWWYPNFNIKLLSANRNIISFVDGLKADEKKPELERKYFFSLNGYNLSESLKFLKNEIQTGIKDKPYPGFMQADDEYYRIYGQLRETYYILKGIQYDYADVLNDNKAMGKLDETISVLKEVLENEPFFWICEYFVNDLSKIKERGQKVATLLDGLILKIKKG